MVMHWREGLHINEQKLLDETGVIGSSEPLMLGRIHRRFQAWKHGPVGTTTINIEVSEDRTVLTDPSSAKWVVEACIKLDAADDHCSFVTDHDGWKFIRATIIDHTGDPVTLVMGV